MSKRPTRPKAGESALPIPRSEFTSNCETDRPRSESPIVSVRKPSEVVPFPSPKPPLIASRRRIVDKGTKRVAFELIPDIHNLLRAMGGPSAPVIPINRAQKRVVLRAQRGIEKVKVLNKCKP